MSGSRAGPAATFLMIGPATGTKNPECVSVRDFYFFTLHFSLFTQSNCLPGIFGSEEVKVKKNGVPHSGTDFMFEVMAVPGLFRQFINRL